MTTWQDWANLKLAELEVYLRSGALDELLAQAFPYLAGLLVVVGIVVWSLGFARGLGFWQSTPSKASDLERHPD